LNSFTYRFIYDTENFKIFIIFEIVGWYTLKILMSMLYEDIYFCEIGDQCYAFANFVTAGIYKGAKFRKKFIMYRSRMAVQYPV